MLNKIDYLLGKSAPRPIFVIGTGRSGTHWLGYSLDGHDEVRATIEGQPMFGWSTRMALDPSLESKLFGWLVLSYRWQLFRSAPHYYLDKTHPNIWIAEKLKNAFPQALFVGITRNPYATVASMMRHKGVSAWHRRWKEFPVPNRFLGITAEMARTYDDMPFAAQCALRWVAHRDKMKELEQSLGDSLMVISYEDFAYDPERTVQKLQNFLGFTKPIPVPDVKVESLDKWKSQLSPQEIQQISATIGISPEDFA